MTSAQDKQQLENEILAGMQQALEALTKSEPGYFWKCTCMGSKHWPHCYWQQHQDAISNLRSLIEKLKLN